MQGSTNSPSQMQVLRKKGRRICGEGEAEESGGLSGSPVAQESLFVGYLNAHSAKIPHKKEYCALRGKKSWRITALTFSPCSKTGYSPSISLQGSFLAV